jgi:hypothetical protein
MRKLLLVVAGALLLSTAGIALARGLNDAKSFTSVAGTFTATNVSNSHTRSCTTVDGKTIVFADATYTGTASGQPELTGPITLRVHSTIDTTDGLGVVGGNLKIAASGGDTFAHVDAVYDHGAIAGLGSGRVHVPHSAGLLGNVSAAFSATGGFTSGKIGGGTAGGSAVELGSAKCASTKTVRETSEAHGTVSAVSSTSITVGGLTCTVPAELAAKVSNTFKVGDRAEIKCSLTGGVNTLVRIGSHH